MFAVGTPNYMAPELLENNINYNQTAAELKSVDVYAMTLVIWEVLSRCHEFYG